MTQLKFLSILPAFLLATSALAGVPNWTMSESIGPVSVTSSGMVRVAYRGASLSAGDVISTGAKARAVIVRGQEYIVVAPNTRIRVADPAKSGGVTQIIEQIGTVVYKIKKMATPHFAVETPFLAAVVKGTTFSVTVTENGASVQVIEGRVEVETRDGGARYLVLPGNIGSVSARAPGRLNIQGRETRTIVSPIEGGSPTMPTAELLTTDPVRAMDGVITVAVSEPPVPLGPATDGMVSGALVAMVTTAPGLRPANLEAKPVANLPPVIELAPVGAVAGPVTVLIAAPASAPVEPIVAPVAAPIVASVAAPVVAPVTTPTSAPVAAPAVTAIAAPVAAPVAAPTSAPVAAPVVAVAAPIVTPVTVPAAAPVAAPQAPVVAPVVGNSGSSGSNNGNGANGTPGGNNGNGANGTGSGNSGNGNSGSNNGNGANGTPGGNSGNGANGTGSGNSGNGNNGNSSSGSNGGGNGNGNGQKGNDRR